MTRDALLRPKVYQWVLKKAMERENRVAGDVNDISLYLLGNCPSHLTRVDMIEIVRNFRSRGKFHTYCEGGNLWRAFTQEAVMLVDGIKAGRF
jgi:hypothetical protein